MVKGHLTWVLGLASFFSSLVQQCLCCCSCTDFKTCTILLYVNLNGKSHYLVVVNMGTVVFPTGEQFVILCVCPACLLLLLFLYITMKQWRTGGHRVLQCPSQSFILLYSTLSTTQKSTSFLILMTLPM